jgi:hypothetical protein
VPRAVVSLVALAGCWTSSGTAVEEAPPPIVVPRPMFKAPRPRGVYIDLVGGWTGHGFQYDNNEDWDIDLTFLGDNVAIGDEVGTVDYPGLSCGGVLLRRPEHADGTLVVQEKITYGTRCIDGGTFQLPPHAPNHQLAWKWFAPETGAEEAQGSVRRR